MVGPAESGGVLTANSQQAGCKILLPRGRFQAEILLLPLNGRGASAGRELLRDTRAQPLSPTSHAPEAKSCPGGVNQKTGQAAVCPSTGKREPFWGGAGKAPSQVSPRGTGPDRGLLIKASRARWWGWRCQGLLQEAGRGCSTSQVTTTLISFSGDASYGTARGVPRVPFHGPPLLLPLHPTAPRVAGSHLCHLAPALSPPESLLLASATPLSLGSHLHPISGLSLSPLLLPPSPPAVPEIPCPI